MKPRLFPAALSLAAAAALLGATTAFAGATGEEWEYTITVDMNGMKMPMQPMKVCMEPDQGDLPPLEPNCQLKSSGVSGATTSFHVVCGEPEPGEMKGQFTRKGDRLEGSYTFTADGEQATMTTVGRKLGKCDPSKEPGSARRG